jgi:NAD(P)-dependent dehydrogenase (short-subunit alcohol dehydrogenase family)
MSYPQKTTIVTGASQGIGAGIVKAFGERGFNVVANSGKVTQSTEVAALNHVALVDGHIGEPATAAKIVETALSRFKSIDALVNNAGIFFTSRRGLHGRGLQVARLKRMSSASCTSPNFPSSKC